jgi:Mn2+/Fe2+ NRAMP family transporter
MGPVLSDQWVARGFSMGGFLVAASAANFRFDHPIASTVLLTLAAYLFIFGLRIAVRNRFRWLDSAVVVLCVVALALCSYRVIQLKSNQHSSAASTADSGDPDAQPVPQ